MKMQKQKFVNQKCERLSDKGFQSSFLIGNNLPNCQATLQVPHHRGWENYLNLKDCVKDASPECGNYRWPILRDQLIGIARRKRVGRDFGENKMSNAHIVGI
jgi:hypothetical protein